MSAYDDMVPEEQEEARDLALLASNIRTWAGPDKVSNEQALATAWQFLDEAAEFLGSLPALSAITPATLAVPGPDAEVVLTGTGFTEVTVINWNGGDEPTLFVSDTEVRTTVKPSTVEAPLPFDLPVYVHNAGVASNTLDFTFTEAAGRRD